VEAPNAGGGGGGKNCIFSIFDLSAGQEVSGSDENLYPSATVVCIQDSALSEECVVSSTTLVIVEVCLSHISLTSALHECDRALQARCVIVEPTAIMHVQNYACS